MPSRNRKKRDTQPKTLKMVSRNAVPLKVVGYARVSTSRQSLDQQRDALEAAGAHVIFADHGISGAKRERDGLDQALAELRAGDVLCVVALDRLGRSLPDLVEIVQSIHDKGAHLRALRESIDTTNSVGRMLFGIFGALAEYERAIQRERTEARLSAMKRRGERVGRKPALTAAQIATAKRELAAGVSAAVVAKTLGCGRSTLYRHLGGA